jgi:hypothetical protein
MSQEIQNEPSALPALYRYLRVADVCDALDGIGYFDLFLYLAIPEEAFAEIFSERIGQLALQKRIKRAFIFIPAKEEIIQWIP